MLPRPSASPSCGDWWRSALRSCQSVGEPDPGQQYRGLDFLRPCLGCFWWRSSCAGSAAPPSSGRRLSAQALVFVLYFQLHDSISYLWYNVIGCAACVAFGLSAAADTGRAGCRRSGSLHEHRRRSSASASSRAGSFPSGFFSPNSRRPGGCSRRSAARSSSSITTATTTRARRRRSCGTGKSGEAFEINFTFENKLQRKYSPLYLKRVSPDWLDKTALQLPAYVDALGGGVQESGCEECRGLLPGDVPADGSAGGHSRRAVERSGISPGGMRRWLISMWMFPTRERSCGRE